MPAGFNFNSLAGGTPSLDMLGGSVQAMMVGGQDCNKKHLRYDRLRVAA